MEWTNSQIKKLGETLREEDPPAQEALARLQAFRLGYEPAMRHVQAVLGTELKIRATSRLKTSNTIVDKLRREKTRLQTMQDIAGVRIVKNMTLAEQDELVAQIVQKLPGSDVVDRRAKPSHGYRAVHVIALVEDRPVEIQVRTELQHFWAQSFEREADRLGRGIRYGELPPGPYERGVVFGLRLMSASIQRAEMQGRLAGAATMFRLVIDSFRELPGTLGRVRR